LSSEFRVVFLNNSKLQTLNSELNLWRIRESNP
jgi:hypothetical protein